MSVVYLAYNVHILKKAIEEGKLTTKEQVKQAAKEINLAAMAGSGNLSPQENEAWYNQFATNIFDNHTNSVPCFVDIGFGRELLSTMARKYNNEVPKKQHWKIIVTRKKFPDWQFNAIVTTYTKEEAICIIKKYFGDFGGLDFNYESPRHQTKYKVPWVHINAKKIGTYKEYIKKTETLNQNQHDE